MIQYKAELVGIKVTLVEEWYTSKCSALDLEKSVSIKPISEKECKEDCLKLKKEF